jgi:predicted nucleic acid-binding protein
MAAALLDAEQDRKASIITLMELLRGAHSKFELRAIRQFFVDRDIEILPLNESIGYDAANLIEKHAHSDGLRIEDALIAATALETGQVLATANVRHFRAIGGLNLRQFRPHH